MKIISWNVNSVRARIDPVIANVGITTAFYKYISADTFIAQIAGIAIVYAWNYLASSSFVWKKSI